LPFNQIEALGVFKTHTGESLLGFAYKLHTGAQLQSIESLPCLVMSDRFGSGDAGWQMQGEFSFVSG
jgi:hypothetical protein